MWPSYPQSSTHPWQRDELEQNRIATERMIAEKRKAMEEEASARMNTMKSEKEQMKLSRLERMHQLEREKMERIQRDREEARKQEELLRCVYEPDGCVYDDGAGKPKRDPG
jgi:hypothetical protein